MKRPGKDELLSMYTKDRLTDGQIARRLEVNRATVYRWRRHYGIEITTERHFQARVKMGGE